MEAMYRSDVGVVDPFFHDHGPDRVCNYDSVLIAVGDSSDKAFTVLPQGKVLAVPLVPVNNTTSFTRVCVNKYQLGST